MDSINNKYTSNYCTLTVNMEYMVPFTLLMPWIHPLFGVEGNNNIIMFIVLIQLDNGPHACTIAIATNTAIVYQQHVHACIYIMYVCV